MSTIQQSLRIYDGMSGPLKNINRVLHTVLDSFEAMQSASGRMVDTSSLQAARQGLQRIDAEFQRMEESAEGVRREQKRLNNSFDEGATAAGRMGRMLKAGVAAVLSARTVTRISDWLKESMDLSDVQRNAEMQLRTVMQNVGMTQEAFEELKRTASGIQGKGIYGDEAMLGGAAEFATYLSDPKAIEKMMGTLSNYAMGMSGGGALDYNQMVDYATQLGKTLNGSYDGLLKKGFTLTDQQKEIIANGTDMQKALVLDEVIAESWDGLYEAMSSTPQGKIIQLQNSIGDLREEVGERVYPLVARIAQIFSDHFDTIQTVVGGFTTACQVVIFILGSLADAAMTAGDFIVDHWTVIAPIVFGIVAALAVWRIAQALLNAELAKSPVVWIVVLVIALVAAVYSVASAIAKTTGVAKTGFGVIAGAVNVVIQFVWNLIKVVGAVLVGTLTTTGVIASNTFLAIGNLIHGVGNVAKTVAENIGIFFENGFHRAKSAALTFVSNAAGKLLDLVSSINNVLGLFGTQIDTSRLESIVSSTAAAASAENSKIRSYEDVGTAFQEGMSTYQYNSLGDALNRAVPWTAFEDGWSQKAFQSGAALGDKAVDKVTGVLSAAAPWSSSTVDASLDPTSAAGKALSGISDGVDSIAGNTADLRDAVGTSSEELKLLREIAERQAINQFTTAEIKVEMTNNNQINSEQDLDGIVRYLEETLEESMYAMAEGVHI